jgi:hypothetical protein
LIKGHPNRESEREIACDPNCCARGLKILIQTERSFGNYNLVGGRLAREKNQPSSLSLQPVKREEKKGDLYFFFFCSTAAAAAVGNGKERKRQKAIGLGYRQARERESEE